MSSTTFAFEESIETALSDLDLASWRSLRFLLEAVKQHDPPSGDKAEDHPVDVGLALAAQLP